MLNVQRMMIMIGYVATKMDLKAGVSEKGKKYRLVKFALRDPWNPDSEYVKCICFGEMSKWCEDNLDGRINQLVLVAGNWKRIKSKDGKKEWIEFFPENIAMIGPRAQVMGPETGWKASDPAPFEAYQYEPPKKSRINADTPWDEVGGLLDEPEGLE